MPTWHRVTIPKNPRRQAKRFYSTARWKRIRAKFLATHPGCAGCHRPATTVDHVIPRESGGSDRQDNLQALCRRCHNSQTTRLDGGGGNVVAPADDPRRRITESEDP